MLSLILIEFLALYNFREIQFYILSFQKMMTVIKYVATATTPCEMVRVKNTTRFEGLQHFR